MNLFKRKSKEDLLKENAKVDAQLRVHSKKAARVAERDMLQHKIDKKKQALSKLKAIEHKDSPLYRGASKGATVAKRTGKGFGVMFGKVAKFAEETEARRARQTSPTKKRKKSKKSRPRALQVPRGGFRL